MYEVCPQSLLTKGQFLAEYHKQIGELPKAEDGYYHIGVPFSIETQRTLLMEAGFRDFEVIWERDSTARWNAAVYVVTK